MVSQYFHWYSFGPTVSIPPNFISPLVKKRMIISVPSFARMMVMVEVVRSTLSSSEKDALVTLTAMEHLLLRHTEIMQRLAGHALLPSHGGSATKVGTNKTQDPCRDLG